MRKSRQEVFENFGKKLIKTARDLTINEEFDILEGISKPPSSRLLSERLKGISSDHLEAIKDLIIDTVDGALNNFLWVVEQEDIDLIYKDENHIQDILSLKEYSDGLCGDYWNFVDKFSRYKRI